jgi:hypothetical protein
MMTVAADRLWEARVLRFGVSRNAVRWGSEIGPELTARLHDALVRCYHRGGRLSHPRDDDGTDIRGACGRVMTAAIDRGGILARLSIVDPRIISALLALEHDARLAQVGLSLVANVLYRPVIELGISVRHVTQIRDVVAVDLVTRPSADGCLLRSIPKEAIA